MGHGTLMLRNSDEYVRPDARPARRTATGRYVDVTGEIFEGQFVDGKRDGHGTTTLPNGNSYRSRWVAGTGSRRLRSSVRLAQSSGQLAQAGANDVRLGVTVDKTKAREGDLVYAASGTGPKLSIQPDNKRLMSLWKGGGEIQLLDTEEGADEYGVFSLDARTITAAHADLRGAEPLCSSHFSRGRVPRGRIRASATCNRQYNLIATWLGAAVRTICRPSKPRISAGVLPRVRRCALRSQTPAHNGRPKTLNVTKKIGNITQTAQVDLEPELRAAGVNICEPCALAVAVRLYLFVEVTGGLLAADQGNRRVRHDRVTDRPEGHQHFRQRRRHTRLRLARQQRGAAQAIVAV